jgi:hypothetical protein
VGELVLAEAVEEVALVLVGIEALEEAEAPALGRIRIVDRIDPRVVPGRHRLAVVEPPRPSGQGPELDGAVAVDAGARRLARLVCLEEGIEDAGPELSLQVEDVERDASWPATRRASSAASSEQQLFLNSL